MKRVLITGSLGYLGSRLSEYLTESGFNVIGYDAEFFKEAKLYAPKSSNSIFRDAREITENDLKNADVVVHLAGISNDPVGTLDAHLVYDPTREYSLRIAKICKKLGVQFIFASSCSVYGVGGDESLSESSIQIHKHSIQKINFKLKVICKQSVIKIFRLLHCALRQYLDFLHVYGLM